MWPRARLLSTAVCKAGAQMIPFHAIARVDCSRIEDLVLTLHLTDGAAIEAHGIDAVEIMMQLKPAGVEGRRLSYGKHMWLVHNLIGHPLMQIFALLGLYKTAFWVHDVTVPRPKGLHKKHKTLK